MKKFLFISILVLTQIQTAHADEKAAFDCQVTEIRQSIPQIFVNIMFNSIHTLSAPRIDIPWLIKGDRFKMLVVESAGQEKVQFHFRVKENGDCYNSGRDGELMMFDKIVEMKPASSLKKSVLDSEFSQTFRLQNRTQLGLDEAKISNGEGKLSGVMRYLATGAFNSKTCDKLRRNMVIRFNCTKK